MSKIHLLALIEDYERNIRKIGCVERRACVDGTHIFAGPHYEHCLALIGDIRKHLASGEAIQANRLLGFVQGVLWAHNVYTLRKLEMDT